MDNHSYLLAKIIKENIAIALLNLGTRRTLDIIAETCEKIGNNGGQDIESIGVFPEAECWKNDSLKIKEFIKNGDITT
jgi:hypothetical protein